MQGNFYSESNTLQDSFGNTIENSTVDDGKGRATTRLPQPCEDLYAIRVERSNL